MRIDGLSYDGRGFHIHDGSKERRIFQNELKLPELAKVTPAGFIDGVVRLRQGRDLTQAFGLEFI